MASKVKRRRWPFVVGAIVLILAVVLIANHNLVRMIFYSNYDPLNKLDVAGDWAGGTAYRNVQYSAVSESDYLNLYVPDTAEPAPLIVVVHGGGFVSNDCESRQAELFYQYFRDHGYACATINYRLAQEAIFPAAVQDVKCAIRFLRANAEKYGYNADRLVVWGESAGGYLAVMMGVTNDEEFNDLPFIGEEALAEPVSSHVSIVLNYYGAVRLETGEERNAAFKALGVPGFVVNIANGWLSSAIEGMPAELKTCEDVWIGRPLSTISQEDRQVFLPEHYIKKNLTPESDFRMLIWHGDADLTVPVTQSEFLYGLLKDTVGEDKVDFAVIHNAKHASERMYTDERLGELKAWLDAALAA